MSIGDEDVAVRSNEHRRWRVEFVSTTAGDPGFAEREQHLAVRTELDNLMTFALLAQPIGDPDVALAIDMDAVRQHQRANAEAFHQVA
jgi:hypothetical protein